MVRKVSEKYQKSTTVRFGTIQSFIVSNLDPT